jgi:hypothetical protein
VPAHYRCFWAHCGEYSPLLLDFLPYKAESRGTVGGQQQSSMFRREAGTEQVLPVYLSSQFFQVQTKKYLCIM